MFEQYPLSPDLEWMLRSQQVSGDLIGETAAREYSQTIHRLVSLAIGDPNLAISCLQDSLVNAILNRHRFPADWDVQTWLFSKAFSFCRRLQLKERVKRVEGIAGPAYIPGQEAQIWEVLESMPAQLRWVLVLRHVYRFDEVGIQRVLGWGKAKVQLHLQTVQDVIRTLPRVVDLAGTDPENKIISSLNTRWESQKLSEAELQQISERVTTRLQTGKRQRYRFDYLVNFGFVTGILAFAALISWLGGNFDKNNSPRVADLQTVIVTKVITVPVIHRVTRTPTPVVTPNPLSEASTALDVFQRMQSSYLGWETMRVNAQIHFYGPPGYIGPPRKFRNLAWVRNTGAGYPVVNNKLLVSGDLDSERPRFASRIDGSSIFMVELDTGLSYYYETGRPEVVINDSLPIKFLGRYSYDYQSIMNGSALSMFAREAAYDPAQIKVVGMDQAAGRDTIIVQAVSGSGQKHRLWIDTHTGLVLRRWIYDSQAPEIVSEEMIVTQIDFDAKIPYWDSSSPYRWLERGDWVSLWQTDVSQENAFNLVPPPGRQPLELRTPPDGYDPSADQLYFVWQQAYNPEIESSSLAEVYTGDYHLGSVPLGNPWNLVCERSRDGMLLAYIQGSEIPDGFSSGLRWFSLADTSGLHEVLTAGSRIGYDFEFSPDGRYLAFSGCGGSESNCGLYLHDTESVINRKIYTDGIPDSITWSQDGRYLAAVANEYSPSGVFRDQQLVVIEVENGLLVHTQPVDWGNQNLLRNLPVGEWYSDFPSARNGLEGCTLPAGS